MTVRFLAPARSELKEAIDYYNKNEQQLGLRFSQAVKRATSSIVQYPLAWPSISEVTRHCQVRGFPYSLIYCITNENLDNGGSGLSFEAKTTAGLSNHPSDGGDAAQVAVEVVLLQIDLLQRGQSY